MPRKQTSRAAATAATLIEKMLRNAFPSVPPPVKVITPIVQKPMVEPTFISRSSATWRSPQTFCRMMIGRNT